MICKHILYITFLNKPKLIFLHTVKWFQILLYNHHNLTSVICLNTVCSIWSIDRTLSGATTPGLCGPGSNSNEGVLYVPQNSSILIASSLDCFESYLGWTFVGGLTPLQRCRWRTLQPQPTRLSLGGPPLYCCTVLSLVCIYPSLLPQAGCNKSNF